MPEHFIPENLGSLAALLVSGTAAIVIVYKKSGALLKDLWTPVWGVAKTIMMLQSAQDRLEKKVADHELELRGLLYLKTDNELIHEKIDAHSVQLKEHSERLHDHQLEAQKSQLQVERIVAQLQTQGLELNQLNKSTDSLNDEIKNANHQAKMNSDQIDGIEERLDLLLRHLLPPSAHAPRKRRE